MRYPKFLKKGEKRCRIIRTLNGFCAITNERITLCELGDKFRCMLEPGAKHKTNNRLRCFALESL
jgi:hypothetical protein